MSSALAIAAVTAVLKHLLDNGLVHQSVASSVGDVVVSALPPDRIPLGSEERSQVNLYLYRVTPNSGWRRSSAPAVTGNGQAGRPPLALDLHYLLTIYGERDFQAEILLGCALQVFHETPILTRDAVQAALASGAPGGSGGLAHPALAGIAASDLTEAIDEITIAPEFLNMEEVSRLWSGLQARYRLSATYKASVVFVGDRHADGVGLSEVTQELSHERHSRS